MDWYLNMILESFYLSDLYNIQKACQLTELALDELESIVGRFNKNSSRSGSLRGEVIILVDNSVIIRHHFNKKQLWIKN